jgi:hypothetical protein
VFLFHKTGVKHMRPPKERETALTMSSEDHSRWHVWTDDPYMMRRLDRLAAGEPADSGKRYTLRADQVLLRKGKPQLSAAQKGQRTRNLKRGTETSDGIGSFDPQAGKLVALAGEGVQRLLIAGCLLLFLAGCSGAQAAETRPTLHESDRLVLEQRMGCKDFNVIELAVGVQRITCAGR